MRNTDETIRHIYRTTENEAVRGYMETTLALILKEKLERKRRQKDRELINHFNLMRWTYANHPSEFVHAKLETALPRTYREIIERGLEVA